VGTIGTNCGANQEKQDGLCYNKCAAGYTPVGPLCWRQCPDGWTDIGVSCAKPAPIHTPGYPWQFGDAPFSLDGARARCQADWGAGNCYTSGALVFRHCPANYQKFGDDICTPVCPDKMRNDGAFCAKDTPSRGVGTIPTCGSGQQSDAGLCYPSCGTGFSGVGPVCWGNCPADYPAQCGAACAKSSEACGVAVADMVLNTAGMLVNLLSFPLGGPGVSAALQSAKAASKTAHFRAVLAAAQPGAQAISSTTRLRAQAYAKDFLVQMLKSQLDRKNLYFTAASLTKAGTLAAMNKAATEAGVLEEQEVFNLKTLMVADITGISSMINSFAKYGSCTSEDFEPSSKSINVGNAGAGGAERTITLTAQQQMTVTRIASPAFQNCSITPRSDCINKQLQPGQTCNITVRVSGADKLDSELRIYTSTYTEIPYAVQVLANGSAVNECKIDPELDEAFNLTAIEGAWATTSQTSKLIMHSGGQVEGYLGNGTVEVRDANKREFELNFANYSNYNFVATMDEVGSSMVVKYSSTASPGTVYTLGTFLRRPWDSRCKPGQTFFAGLCYEVPAGNEMTAPGFYGKICPPDWRDDGTSCYPPWTGKNVPAQAEPEGSYTLRHPIVVTDCGQYSTARGQECPANFKNTGGPAGCSCEAQPTSKSVRALTGTVPSR
jgi:hypothetical protein